MYSTFNSLLFFYYRIKDIEPEAVLSTAAHIEFVGNDISNFHTSGFVFNNWNRIIINDNIIKHLHANFVVANTNAEMEGFSFKGNDMYSIERGALSFLAHVPEEVLHFDDNVFNEPCNCSLGLWLEGITHSSKQIKIAMDSNYCMVNEFLGRCVSLPAGLINIQNFTDRICSNFTKCEPREEKIHLVNATQQFANNDQESYQKHWFIFVIAIVGFLLIAIISSFIILLMRGSRILKDKCFFRNVQYNNELTIDEEATAVTSDDDNEKLQFPEELTMEFLQILSKRLDDPITHQEASEMIERLYEMFIVDDSYENNNREEEAHLYEELGNLSLQIPPPPYEENKDQNSRSILKLMEEKINFTPDEQNLDDKRPTLMTEYSEPNDAAVHLYSEIKNKGGNPDCQMTANFTGSSGSVKENNLRNFISEPGPSTKF